MAFLQADSSLVMLSSDQRSRYFSLLWWCRVHSLVTGGNFLAELSPIYPRFVDRLNDSASYNWLNHNVAIQVFHYCSCSVITPSTANRLLTFLHVGRKRMGSAIKKSKIFRQKWAIVHCTKRRNDRHRYNTCRQVGRASDNLRYSPTNQRRWANPTVIRLGVPLLSVSGASVFSHQ